MPRLSKGPSFGKNPDIQGPTGSMPRLSQGPVLGSKPPKGLGNALDGNANDDPDLNPGGLKKTQAFKGLMSNLKRRAVK